MGLLIEIFVRVFQSGKLANAILKLKNCFWRLVAENDGTFENNIYGTNARLP